uniref:Methyltransferase type 11 domain-containing protein n=1 Tax=Panagrolaimus sp. JU765 TaxID=591449 RepID=A0AC34QBN9_9BILA
MVVIQTPSEMIATTNNEFCMMSGNSLHYVAPVSLITGNNDYQQVVMLVQEKRLLFGDVNDEFDKWVGVGEMCQAIDNLVEIDQETGLFNGKTVLEVGFTSGLPSVYAMNHGAKSVTIYNESSSLMDAYVKPTMRRNNLNENVEYLTGDFENLRNILQNKKFDVIIAPEMVNTKLADFEEIHEILDQILADNGIVIFSGRTHYSTCDGNMPAMLDLIKSKNSFDVIDRSQLFTNQTVPRKIVQLIRK